MSICTGRGKDGETDLLFGKRISKSDERIHVIGDIDELNAWLGVARAGDVSEDVIGIINDIQKDLVSIMGELATEAEDLPKYEEKGYSKINEASRERVRELIVQAESGDHPVKFRGWARPGKTGVQQAAMLDVCRTICRRAERNLWTWDSHNTYLLHKRYLNNLSDLLWVLAREGEREVE